MGTLSLQNGTFNWGAGPHVQALTVDAALKGAQLTVFLITGNVATGGIVGSFSARRCGAYAGATLSAIDGALTIDAAKFTFSGILVEQRRPSRIDFGRGIATIADAEWSVAENALQFGGSVGFAAEDPLLNLSLNGLVDCVLSAFGQAWRSTARQTSTRSSKAPWPDRCSTAASCSTTRKWRWPSRAWCCLS